MNYSLKHIAQMSMDAYYQAYKTPSQFLGIEHFSLLCILADAKLKQIDFEKQKAFNIRLKIFNAPITLSDTNYEEKIVDAAEEIDLGCNVMKFQGDDYFSGIIEVSPKGSCAPFIRISKKEEWQACKITDVIFWIPNGNKIELLNLGKACKPSKIKVTYVPTLNNKSEINQGRAFDILSIVQQYILQAKNGNVIDMSNDNNPNVSLSTEINKYLIK